MSNATVILEFSVDGLPLIGNDNVFHEDTDITPDEWSRLSEDEREGIAHELFCEHVQYGWHAALAGIEA
ncbi:hypothetical protein [Zymobacter sp. IVIA_5232.4 C2]|uniref:hypothetical protein n=1 Tax=Zymobacter sp. IVIA_5232.4 C2 TaxID=3394855 RepID=UPI0039C1CC98